MQLVVDDVAGPRQSNPAVVLVGTCSAEVGVATARVLDCQQKHSAAEDTASVAVAAAGVEWVIDSGTPDSESGEAVGSLVAAAVGFADLRYLVMLLGLVAVLGFEAVVAGSVGAGSVVDAASRGASGVLVHREMRLR